MTEHAPEGSDPTGTGADPVADDEDDRWGVNTALGAAALAARTASDVADAVGASAPGRVVESAARWLTRPLAREGEEVRHRLEEEGVPAAQEAIRAATPGVVQAVDINGILAAIDVDALLDRIDVDRLVDRIDVGAVVAKVDVNAVVAKVDVNALVSQVDVNALVSQVDVNALVAQVDLDSLLESVDLDALLERIDVGALLDRIDVNELVQRLDMDALVANTEFGSIIVQSTSGVASHALDSVRSQGVGMDNFIARVANRVLRRDPAALVAGPPLLIDAQLALPSPATTTDPDGAVR